MSINAFSRMMSLSKELENESATFYRGQSGKYEEGKDLFLTFAEENGEFVAQIERNYCGSITDAIERFAFTLNSDEYRLNRTLQENRNYSDALVAAVNMEEIILKFYRIAVEQSKDVMADVPKLFTFLAKKREERISKLKSLLNENKKLMGMLAEYMSLLP